MNMKRIKKAFFEYENPELTESLINILTLEPSLVGSTFYISGKKSKSRKLVPIFQLDSLDKTHISITPEFYLIY